jgi:hypothetical protein
MPRPQSDQPLVFSVLNNMGPGGLNVQFVCAPTTCLACPGGKYTSITGATSSAACLTPLACGTQSTTLLNLASYTLAVPSLVTLTLVGGGGAAPRASLSAVAAACRSRLRSPTMEPPLSPWPWRALRTYKPAAARQPCTRAQH